ncbi:Beta-lactamase-like protein 2 [Strongyloides ratti]|uniref:Beta-lactamase-like protein 2 homolog n=1 Tax=Strongyloides ratti TaxID=34506 RepID=A0A090LN34_STRRB|nr:Beta-lactamase-like protein 2 [Strongyloides ratti]CEF69584.1 Beta-lactamase-like protein 2 [Strongyloides ratti]
MLGSFRNYIDYTVGVGAYLMSKFVKSSMAQKLTPLDNISKLSPTVTRVLGQNPSSFTLLGTNTYLVGSGEKKVLIDTGEKNIPKYIDLLKEALGTCKIDSIIITHWHGDHVGGIPDILKITNKNIPIYKIKRPDIEVENQSELYNYVEDGYIIKTDGATLKMIATPGHTMDHAVVYLEEEKALFSGDCVLGEGTSVFEDLYTYMNSLNILLSLNPEIIYPGHGPVIKSPKDKITEYIKHRNQREEQILKCLEGKEYMTSMDITNNVYTDINLSVKIGAWNNVRNHLSKLLKEKKITEISNDRYKLN